eukprot:CAMPEP_0174286626 /NCGR_PEP_ID=MMETSP0809-20121228/12719_1 /TAXON_ID=73025 ORGANISM="Eutreptiella gymnastica-like, Strain CCMP1594" /NCGR_SAMPLE_ID=MMETSP0809 /ASSEMBLY_ACC=CAM_ASM_000658 /LENGTH=64 /DNA_ID=CAMNT_0015382779 /DNA_START=177 /DNA_END=371 /DNA_ORIENTATION=-
MCNNPAIAAREHESPLWQTKAAGLLRMAFKDGSTCCIQADIPSFQQGYAQDMQRQVPAVSCQCH